MSRRPGLTRRDRELDAAAMAARAEQLAPLLLGDDLISSDDECANCNQPRSHHRTVAPHDRVLGRGPECAGFKETGE